MYAKLVVEVDRSQLWLHCRLIAAEKSKEIPSSVILKIVKRDPAFSIVRLTTYVCIDQRYLKYGVRANGGAQRDFMGCVGQWRDAVALGVERRTSDQEVAGLTPTEQP